MRASKRRGERLRAIDAERRLLFAQLHGLDALDRRDGFGANDDYYGGFAEFEDDAYRPF